MKYNFFLLLLSYFLTSNSTYAFTFNNNVEASFGTETIYVNVAAHSCQNISLTPQQLLELANEAINNFWNTIPTSSLELAIGGVVSVSSAFQTDSICSSISSTGECTPNSDLSVDQGILISCNTDTSGQNFSTGILGLSVPNNTNGSTINGSVVLINDTSSTIWHNFNHADQVSILAHEIGHAIGLGHSSVKDSLMYYNTVEKRSMLGVDDMDGITYLYPLDSPIASCGQISMYNNFSFFLMQVLFFGLLSIFLGKIAYSSQIRRQN